ncbi:hypothetical protein AALA61_04000 [Oscillospiraceae bacterium 42-9]
MATTRIMPLHIGKGRTESQAVSDIIDYVSNPQKTDNGRLVTGFACDSRVADAEFLLSKREYISTTGRVRGADDVLAYHGLLEYAVLEEKAAAATTRHNELSAQIKAAETRMAEIAVLRTHIINYVKTREVYAAYRKAGYSKKFLAEHEADILLHKAAKQAFDDLGIKKLPTVKSLQAEYATLLEGKKKDYAEYRRSREEMRELLAAKANVDRLMGYGEERQNDREKEQGQDR